MFALWFGGGAERAETERENRKRGPHSQFAPQFGSDSESPFFPRRIAPRTVEQDVSPNEKLAIVISVREQICLGRRGKILEVGYVPPDLRQNRLI